MSVVQMFFDLKSDWENVLGPTSFDQKPLSRQTFDQQSGLASQELCVDEIPFGQIVFGPKAWHHVLFESFSLSLP
jgi:hypothetical protein